MFPLCRAGGILPYIPRQGKSGRLHASAPGSPAFNEIAKWMGIVFAMGVALMVVEYRFAKKKKEGFTPIDRKRIVGIFWLTIFFCLLIGGLMWFSD
jgi:hypothetical protein